MNEDEKSTNSKNENQPARPADQVGAPVLRDPTVWAVCPRFRYRAILWFSTLRYAPICLSLALKRVASKMLYPRKFALFPS